MDFTLKQYELLIDTLKNSNYQFLSFDNYIRKFNSIKDDDLIIILRHDVDAKPKNSLRMAKLEHSFGITGSYYFRAAPCSWNDEIIRSIEKLGHEIGYHYETMDTANGDIEKAWRQFKEHLGKLREIARVTTACMHGSPQSKFDNKDIWEKYDYKSIGIIGEPYYDIDFDYALYLTDTGRRWDGFNVSVRDKVSAQKNWIDKGFLFRSTNDIIQRISKGNFPNHVMFNFHPQRWNSKFYPWLKELIIQNLKNQIKRLIIIKNSRSI